MIYVVLCKVLEPSHQKQKNYDKKVLIALCTCFNGRVTFCKNRHLNYWLWCAAWGGQLGCIHVRNFRRSCYSRPVFQMPVEEFRSNFRAGTLSTQGKNSSSPKFCRFYQQPRVNGRKTTKTSATAKIRKLPFLYVFASFSPQQLWHVHWIYLSTG